MKQRHKWGPRVLFSLSIAISLVGAACGDDDDSTDRTTYEEQYETPTTVKVGQTDENGQVQQKGYLDAEVVVFPDGQTYNCVIGSYDATPACFPANAR